MRKRNYVYMLLTVFLIFQFSMPAQAQIIASVTDNSCTAAIQCAGQSGHGCNSTNFTASTGTYRLTASIDECVETSTACRDCLAEAYIYKLGEEQGNYIACHHNSCGSSCASQFTNVSLSSGITYVLFCCKIDCSNDNCSPCASTCTARATVDNFP